MKKNILNFLAFQSMLSAMICITSCEKPESDDAQEQLSQITEKAEIPLNEYEEILNEFIAKFDMTKEDADLFNSGILSSGLNGTGKSDKISIAEIGVNYTSVDGNGNIDTISGKIMFPVEDGKCLFPKNSIGLKGLVISCHATQPQSGSAGDFDMSKVGSAGLASIAGKGYLVFAPDYIGFGTSSNTMQTYLCQKLIARNCADMIIPGLNAAMNATNAKGVSYGVSMVDNFGTYIIGYSQGGGNALALTRYLTIPYSEGGAPDEIKNVVSLKHSYCGSGPYNPPATFKYWLDKDTMTMSMLFPMVVCGQKAGHPDIMGNTDPKSYFSQNFINSGIPDGIISMNGDMAASITYDKTIGTMKPGKLFYAINPSYIMSEEAKNPESDIRRRLQECLDYEDVSSDWTPTTPITFFASRVDQVVPAINTDSAYNALSKKAEEGLVNKYVITNGDHITGMLPYFNAINRYDMLEGYNNIVGTLDNTEK